MRLPSGVRHRDDLAVEAARVDRVGRPLMTAYRELVLRGAADAVDLRHLVGRFAHHLTGGALLDLRAAGQQVGERCQTPRGAEVVARLRFAERQRCGRVDQLLRQPDRRVRGRVAAARDHHVVFAPLDGGGSGGDRLESGRAGPGDGMTLDAVAESQIECDLAGDVRRARRQDHAAPDDRVDRALGQFGAVEQAADRLVGECDRVEGGEVAERTHEGGAGAGDDDGAVLGCGHG